MALYAKIARKLISENADRPSFEVDFMTERATQGIARQLELNGCEIKTINGTRLQVVCPHNKLVSQVS